MPSRELIAEHRVVQGIARALLDDLALSISPEDSEFTIAEKAVSGLCSRGAPDTWYYNCPAFVLLGARSCLSISGRDYQPAEKKVGLHNLVTVDLSPVLGGRWGDCARSFYVEDGSVTSTPTSPEFLKGQLFLASLHAQMRRLVTSQTSFHALWEWTNRKIKEQGFENLDFLANVGHSIATTRDARQYIEKGNMALLGDVPFFTFEPHVRELGGTWGFKHENIFFFNNEHLLEEL